MSATVSVRSFAVSLWQALDARALGYEVVEHVAGERATHVIVRKRA